MTAGIGVTLLVFLVIMIGPGFVGRFPDLDELRFPLLDIRTENGVAAVAVDAEPGFFRVH